MAQQLRARINKSLERRNTSPEEERRHIFTRPPPEPKVPISTIFSKKLTFMDIDEEEIARQLTIIEHNLFASIQPTEFLNKGWLEQYQRNKSPHLKQMIQRSWRMANWVRFGISLSLSLLVSVLFVCLPFACILIARRVQVAQFILKAEDMRKRKQYIEKFLKIALVRTRDLHLQVGGGGGGSGLTAMQNLRTLNNFHVMASIVNGFNLISTDPRFSSAWFEFPPRFRDVRVLLCLAFRTDYALTLVVQVYNELSALTQPNNIKLYKEKLAQAEKPAIPIMYAVASSSSSEASPLAPSLTFLSAISFCGKYSRWKKLSQI
jgi:hypothetical protein